MQVRQAKAREMGTSHTNFMIDATPKDGTMKLDTVIRLRSGFRQHAPRVVRVIYNGKALCGRKLLGCAEALTRLNSGFIIFGHSFEFQQV